MQTQPLGEWEIVVWDWHDKTPTDCIYIGVCADKAYDAAYDHDGKQGQSGYLAGAINAYSSYKYIHFIAHSAGAKLINEVAKTLARDKSEGGERPFIHLTFLDAYAPNGEDREGDKSYGYLQDYHNHYYSEHYVDRTYSQIPDWIILTNTVLPHAFNFDITGWGDEKDGSEYGHKWPRVWYTRSIGFPNRTGGGLLGFGLSLEGNNKNFCRLAEQFPPGDSCQLNNIGSAGLCGTFIRNSAPCR